MPEFKDHESNNSARHEGERAKGNSSGWRSAANGKAAGKRANWRGEGKRFGKRAGNEADGHYWSADSQRSDRDGGRGRRDERGYGRRDDRGYESRGGGERGYGRRDDRGYGRRDGGRDGDWRGERQERGSYRRGGDERRGYRGGFRDRDDDRRGERGYGRRDERGHGRRDDDWRGERQERDEAQTQQERQQQFESTESSDVTRSNERREERREERRNDWRADSVREERTSSYDRGDRRAPRPRRESAADDGMRNLRGGADKRARAKELQYQLPESITPESLPEETRKHLRGLNATNADLVARHLAYAGEMMDIDPQVAYDHAKAAYSRAARIDIVREAVGIAAYVTGRYSEALTELRAYRRLSDDFSHVALEADAERGLGRSEKALRFISEIPLDRLDAAAKIELAIVTAGAKADMGDAAGALALMDKIIVANLDDELAARVELVKADQLETLGRAEEAQELRAKWEPIYDGDEEDTDMLVDLADVLDDAPANTAAEELGEEPTGDEAAAEAPVDEAETPAADEPAAEAPASDEVAPADDEAEVPADDEAEEPAEAAEAAEPVNDETVSDETAEDEAAAEKPASDEVVPADEAAVEAPVDEAETPAADEPAAEAPASDEVAPADEEAEAPAAAAEAAADNDLQTALDFTFGELK